MTRIETERLRLRVPEAADIREIIRYYSENRAHLDPWGPAAPDGFYTQPFWERRIQRWHDEAEASTALHFVVAEKAQPHVVIGTVNLTHIAKGIEHAGTIGYGLAESMQGRGYMREAVRAVVRYAFDTLNLHRVEANYIPRNDRSGRLLKDLGFHVDGYAREYLFINERWEDHVLTAKINPNWRDDR